MRRPWLSEGGGHRAHSAIGPVMSAPARRVSTLRRAASARIAISSARARSAASVAFETAPFAAACAALHAASAGCCIAGSVVFSTAQDVVSAHAASESVSARNDARAALVPSVGDSRYSFALIVRAGCDCESTWLEKGRWDEEGDAAWHLLSGVLARADEMPRLNGGLKRDEDVLRAAGEVDMVFWGR